MAAERMYVYSGAGSIVANEGNSATTYVQGGENNRHINNPSTTYNSVTLARAETPPKPSSNIPFARDPDFINRKDLTLQIDAILSAPAARVALVGIGGVGKSQIAIEYCYSVQEQSRDTWVLWIHASNTERYEQSVRDIADLVRIHGREDPKANIHALFRGWLRDERKGRWTIVLDNADDADFLVKRHDRAGRALFEYLPFCEHGRVLVTTRTDTAASRLVLHSQIVDINLMDEEHAVALLEKKLGRQDDRADLTALAYTLEYMPLAIAQAAAYIRRRRPRCSVPQYLEQLQSSDQLKMNLLSAPFEELRRDADAKNSILLTWQVSFDHIHQTQRSAAELLSLMSFFHHQEIPESLLTLDADAFPRPEFHTRSSAKAISIWTRTFRRALPEVVGSRKKRGRLWE
nr:hypothetical protein CFP56_02868 [Quercus suber]